MSPRPKSRLDDLIRATAMEQLQQAIPPMPSHATEDEFARWYAEMAQRHDLHPNPDDPAQAYDYRAAHQAGATPDASGHWPSDFKREGHPQMVVGGFHVKTGARVPGTPQATTDELIRLGWDADFARQHGRKP